MIGIVSLRDVYILEFCCRGRVQISNDGTRFVTMGRGHAWYEVPARHKKVNQQIREAYGNRKVVS